MSRFRPETPASFLLIGVVVGALLGACAAGANQPNMQAALSSLQAARAELIQARPNKGGHRERAINFVDAAISETQNGIMYAGD